MSNDQIPSSIQEKIRAQIQAGDLRPRSRFVFIVQMASVVVSALLALAATLTALSFIFYSVYESGEAFLLGFGWEGISIFLLLFPWMLVVLAALLLALFQWRLSYVIPTYRIPVLPLFALLIIVVASLGYVIAPVHSVFIERIEESDLPVVGQLYENIYASREGYGIYRGIVVSMEDRGVWMIRSDGDADDDDGPRFVLLPDGTEALVEGYELFVLGREEDEAIYASHVVAFPLADK